MIREWLSYLTTPCPRPLRRMGYLRQAISLQSRYRRCRAAWAPHLEACRATIRAAAEGSTRRGRAVVLGSGLLAEVPLDFLAERFTDVVLIDIVHLRAARRRAARFANVRMLAEDVSGVVDAVYDAVETGAPLPVPTAHGPAVARDADLVVSVGLLSQLALLPVEYAARGEVDSRAFSAALVQAHLDWLRGLPGTVCLITDIERLACRDDGTAVDVEDALAGITAPALDGEWLWDIAPVPEADPHVGFRNRVAGGVLRYRS